MSVASTCKRYCGPRALCVWNILNPCQLNNMSAFILRSISNCFLTLLQHIYCFISCRGFSLFFALLKCKVNGSNKNISESRLFLELWDLLKVLLLNEYRDPLFLHVFQILSSLDISSQQVKFEGKSTVSSISMEFT